MLLFEFSHALPLACPAPVSATEQPTILSLSPAAVAFECCSISSFFAKVVKLIEMGQHPLFIPSLTTQSASHVIISIVIRSAMKLSATSRASARP
jgi:hypothetical protein